MSGLKLLDGIRVLDLSRVLAGPWSGQILADYGADVIKVERPGGGDDTRTWGPPWWGDPADRMSAYYLSANRGKRSIAIDIAHDEGANLVRQLAAEADVVLENYKVGQLTKYGLDYASLSKLNPRVVYCSVTGYGQTGPMATAAGYDFAIQATGGLMSVTGEKEGTPGSQPQKVGVAVADLFTGVYATTAILAALIERGRTGKGRHIDAALLDVQVAMLANQASNHLVGGIIPQRMGNAHLNVVPYQVFTTQDGHIVLAVGNDGQFARFCTAAGYSEWAADERFATNPARVANRTVLIPLLRQATVMKTTAEWISTLESLAVPCGPINRLPEVFDDPQVVARGLRIDVPHPAFGSVPLVACPIRLSATPVQYRSAPPMLGEHTAEVLAEWLRPDHVLPT